MADQGQRTEQPTQRRLDKARRDGRFPSTREFTAAIQFLLFVALAGAYAATWFGSLGDLSRRTIESAFHGELTPAGLGRWLRQTARVLLLPLGIGGFLMIAASAASHLALTGFGFAPKKLAPDFNKLNPVKKLSELPKQNLPQLVQALVLLPLFLAAVWAVAAERFPHFLRLPLEGIETGAAVAFGSLRDLLWKAAFLVLAWGAVDLFRQVRRHRRELRMTKQEVREEMKESEGSPEAKGRLRRLRRDLLRRKMMREVPRATAVIVNPTHYAVAIRYAMESMAAPTVVAKGKNYLALRIRKIATENQVPVIENPPLAQSLYKSAAVGQEIPPALYRAVAEILAYLFRLRQGRR
ncbi:MAG: EscU/YscU/HrcU family type III secretion system export apparatus switch protein [Bryobacterales bacterium]|nr:EscU/YscU/HrcU family type III secretion system export apparatus switch protein [Bryobacterales bacterium]